MRLYGVKSPAELAKEKKSEFFTEIRNDWSKHKLLKLQLKETNTKKIQPTFEEPLEGHVDKLIVAIETESPFLKEEWHQKDYTSQPFKEKKTNHQEQENPPHEFVKQIIKSEPNQEQTDELRILFNPNSHFLQDDQYQYPVVKMPKQNAILKLPAQDVLTKRGTRRMTSTLNLNSIFLILKLPTMFIW